MSDSEEAKPKGGNEPITIRVKDQRGEDTRFKIKKSIKMCKVFGAYAQRKGVDPNSLRFLLDGERIQGKDTAKMLGLKDEDQIDCAIWKMTDERIDYRALAATIEIEDIASSVANAEILSDLKDDIEHDKGTVLYLVPESESYFPGIGFRSVLTFEVRPDSDYELGWLGYFARKSTNLTMVEIDSRSGMRSVEYFCRELAGNQSIQTIRVVNLHDTEVDILSNLVSFAQRSQSFRTLTIGVNEENNNWISASAFPQLASFLGSFNSLIELAICAGSVCNINEPVKIVIRDPEMTDDLVASVILPLMNHTKLKRLSIDGTGCMGNNSCRNLNSVLMSRSLTGLRLGANCIQQQQVNFFAAGLEHSKFLKSLAINDNFINGKEAKVFIQTLRRCQFQVLENNLDIFGLITSDSDLVGALPWLLCDTSSINNTFLSNHTIKDVNLFCWEAEADVASESIWMNGRGSNIRIAVNKILRYHHSLDMEPFFERGFDLFPYVIEWFEGAKVFHQSYLDSIGKHSKGGKFEANIEEKKLSYIFQFVRSMPQFVATAMKNDSTPTILRKRRREE